MATDARRLAILVTILVALLAVLGWTWTHPPGADNMPPQPARSATPAQGRSPVTPQAEVPDVRLESLTATRAAPVDVGRNLFRFEAPKPAPVPDTTPKPPSAPARPSIVAETPPMPPGPPPPPPIPFKFIGILNAPGPVGKVAVLSDGRFVYHGREGQVIEGQYRIVRIGEESIEMEYVDGRGRQTIRLTGS